MLMKMVCFLSIKRILKYMKKMFNNQIMINI